jgi:hypothetical protein
MLLSYSNNLFYSMLKYFYKLMSPFSYAVILKCSIYEYFYLYEILYANININILNRKNLNSINDNFFLYIIK